MIFRSYYGRRAVLALCAAGTLLGPVGCQGHRVVARVGSASITEDDYYDRTMHITSSQFQNMPDGIDAGAIAMVGMIHEALIGQLAAEKKVAPSEDTVLRLASYVKRVNPNSQVSPEDIARSIRLNMETFGIGTDGAKADPKDVEDTYKTVSQAVPSQTNPEGLKVPAMIKARLLPMPTEALAQQALDQLKRGVTFETVATQFLNLPPANAAAITRGTTIPVTGLPPALRDALQSVADNQYTAKPIAVQQQNPQTQTMQTAYVIAQVLSKQPEYVPPLEEVRPLIEQTILTKTHPDWRQHENAVLAEFTRGIVSNSQIQIDIPRYKPLLATFIMPTAEVNTLAPPGSAFTPPGGSAAPSAGAPSAPGGKSPAPGGSAPPSGAAGTPAAPPTGNKPAPSAPPTAPNGKP